ncbi:PPE family protein [Mycobacterium camsae]|uniref:PPE family protein n=1 Tax=Mycobacterium gordonae TaxID=1778 RepID=UPI001981CDD8|nr:PPE family protein [Mycobacterium gordonae]
MDFGSLPPEVNSGRMYTGPGAGSLLVAAEMWEILALDLYSAASSVQSVVWGMTVGPWIGSSAALMAAAAAPYLAWINVTAAQAELTANQARTTAAAFESAFAMTVPPPVIAENRTQLMVLIATNLLGQNTPAIAVTEAEYGEMWAQDAAAMYGYAGIAAAATETLSVFEEAPEITTMGGVAEEVLSGSAVEQATDSAAATQLMSNVPQALQQLATPTQQGSTQTSWLSGTWKAVSPHLSPISNIISMVNNNFSMLNSGVSMTNTTSSFMKGMVPAAAKAVEGAVDSGARAMGTLGNGVGAPGGAGVVAGLGRAAAVGELSVPQGWAAANQAVTPAARALTTVAGAGAVDAAPEHVPSGLPVGQLGGRAGSGLSLSNVLRVPPRAYVMPRSPAAG